jgi:UDP-N-acetylmuramate--alanine ligase
MEIYDDLDDLINCFEQFANQTKELVLANGDNDAIRRIHFKTKVLYYGFNDNNDLVIKNKEVSDNKTKFDVYYNGEFFDHYETNMFGNHLVLDAVGAIAVSILYDIDKKIIKEVLENFVFAKRRFNETEIKDNVIIDDYAHHPTEIRVTYDSAHEKYPDKKIIAVFMPNTYSRTEALFNDFIKALGLYDKAYITDIKCNRERQEDYPNINSDKLINKIAGAEKISLEEIDKLKDYHNTVICFMSCADISPLVEKTKELLK